MGDLQWINIASKSLRFCADLLHQIKQLTKQLERVRDENTRLKALVQQLEQQHGGYDTVY